MDGQTAAGMRYWTYGHGRRDTFLLVHGWCCDHDFMAPWPGTWPPARPGDRRRHARPRGQPTPGRRLRRPEMAGPCGPSSRARPSPRVFVIGHSLGGVWSLRAAAGDRDRFTGLGLLDSAVAGPPGSPPRSPRWRRRCGRTPRARSGVDRPVVLPAVLRPAPGGAVVAATARPSTEVAYAPIAGLADWIAAERTWRPCTAGTARCSSWAATPRSPTTPGWPNSRRRRSSDRPWVPALRPAPGAGPGRRDARPLPGGHRLSVTPGWAGGRDPRRARTGSEGVQRGAAAALRLEHRQQHGRQHGVADRDGQFDGRSPAARRQRRPAGQPPGRVGGVGDRAAPRRPRACPAGSACRPARRRR